MYLGVSHSVGETIDHQMALMHGGRSFLLKREGYTMLQSTEEEGPLQNPLQHLVFYEGCIGLGKASVKVGFGVGRKGIM